MQIVIDIPKELVTDIKDYCGMSMEALPIIVNAICNGIPLDKIRAEVEHEGAMFPDGEFFVSVDRINEIIDKYKAEGEDKG